MTIILVLFLGIIVPIRMITKVYEEITPEGRYNNYKTFILESVDMWTKDRENGFVNQKTIINWYETPNDKGARPMDKYPDFIYEEIKNATHIVFDEYATVKDREIIKKEVGKRLDSKKGEIITKLENSKK